jgi:alginate O-acetyltransferase complex protein AlgI
MLFNSYIFLFIFLPLTLLGYFLIGKTKYPRVAIFWLIAASLVFYGWANPYYLPIIICSIIVNYIFGLFIVKTIQVKQKKLIMVMGVTLNILLLGYFKYTNFFISNLNNLLSTNFSFRTIILPLAISFITLQQIAYILDIYRGEPREHNFWEYCLFVTFFPKLLSGPIVRIKELIPQIKDFKSQVTSHNLAIGLTILFLGLFKKVVIADRFGGYASPIFDAASQGSGVSFYNSWIGALAYAFQIYFDFSGYCDMAIGLGLMFGIRLPLNFYSPYKGTSIIDFWRRWHMTLSRFIRDYIYIPLGGNRQGFNRQMINLVLAMMIAGLWHGAAWTFVIWGTLHGIYLVTNHGWRRLFKLKEGVNTLWGTILSTSLTFIAVTVAWVFFNAASIDGAVVMLKSMIGLNGFHLTHNYYVILGPVSHFLTQLGPSFSEVNELPGFSLSAVVFIVMGLLICWFLPNVQEYMSSYQTSFDSFIEPKKKPGISWLRWQPSIRTVAVLSCLVVVAILSLSHEGQFIYFKF